MDDSNKESVHCGSGSFDKRGSIKSRRKEETRDYCLANDDLCVSANSLNRIDRFKNMVKIVAGTFAIGTNDPVFIADGEGPKRQIFLDNFYIDEMEVSNGDFARFVDVTNYRTEAERFGDSFVFRGVLEEKNGRNVTLVAQAPWWVQIKNANWRCPEGPSSDIKSTFILYSSFQSFEIIH